jgi:hypothetical protein
MPKLGPYNSNATLTKLDGRTREARLVKSLRTELAAHVGGKPSTAQHALIEQAVQIRLRLALMDRKFSENDILTDHDSRTYLAWSNSLSRLMRQLGLKAAPSPKERWQPQSGQPAAPLTRAERRAQASPESA